MAKDENIIIAIRIKLMKSYFIKIFCFNAILFNTKISMPKDIKAKGQNFIISFSIGKLKNVTKKNAMPIAIDKIPRVMVPTRLDCIIYHRAL